MKHALSFSGGKDSTALLFKMIEEKMQIDRIICIDTTKEFPEMYEHIEKVKRYIEPYGLVIEIIKIDFDYWFSEHIKTRGKRKGNKEGYGWPDFRNRWCTALKRSAFKKTVPGKDVLEYHGISFDETERTDKNKDGRDIEYPLIDWKMTGGDCIEYCYSKGFDWGGLYEKMSRVSCWCCPLSRIGELKILHDEYPDLWAEIKNMDCKSYRKFRSDYTVDELTNKFKV